MLALIEAARVITAWRNGGLPRQWRLKPAATRLIVCTFTGVGVFFGLLGIMDQIATPYADADAKLITGGPFAHMSHMISYAAGLVSPHGPQGIASYPWQWLLDLKPITYLRINPSLPGNGLYAIHPVSQFIGHGEPADPALAIPALAFGAYRLIRLRREPPVTAGGPARPAVDAGETQLAIVGVGWFLGTWLPFALLSLVDQRTSYLYYMVIVMPGIYVAVAYAVWRAWLASRGGVGDACRDRPDLPVGTRGAGRGGGDVPLHASVLGVRPCSHAASPPRPPRPGGGQWRRSRSPRPSLRIQVSWRRA